MRWTWPFGWTDDRGAGAANTNDGAFTQIQRTVIECGVHHACGGRCFMYDMNKEWMHHCGDHEACDVVAHQRAYDDKVSVMRERKAE